MNTSAKILAIASAAMMLTVALPAALVGVGPIGAAAAQTDRTFIVDIVPGGRQELPGDPVRGAEGSPLDVMGAADNDLPEWTGGHDEIATISLADDPETDVDGGWQNLRSENAYYCESGYPVGTVDNGLLKGTAKDAADRDGPVGHYEIDGIIAAETTGTTTAGVSEPLLTGITIVPGFEPRVEAGGQYYGADIYYSPAQKPETLYPTYIRPIVYVYCVTDAGTEYATQVLPQTVVYDQVINQTTGDTEWVERDTGAKRGVFGTDYMFDWTAASSGEFDMHSFIFIGDCADPNVLWEEGDTRTCDEIPGAAVDDSAWYYDGDFGMTLTSDMLVDTPLRFSFILNPQRADSFPDYYNTLYQPRDMQCLLNDGDALGNNCGGHTIWVTTGRYPDVDETRDPTKAIPVAEDIDLYGNSYGAEEVIHPASYEASAAMVATAECSGIYIGNNCPITGGGSLSPLSPWEYEPNHPEDPDEHSAIGADGTRSMDLVNKEDAWVVLLDVVKGSDIQVFVGTDTDPLYAALGNNASMACTYDTSSDPHRPNPGSGPCNRRDVYPVTIWFNAQFGLARDENGDGAIDERYAEEWIGLPDRTWDPTTNDYVDIADVGFVGNATADGFGGNDIAFDVTGGKVIQVHERCSEPGVVETNEENLYEFEPATADASGKGVPAASNIVGASVVDTTYADPLAITRPDIAACNAAGGNADEGWGTFYGINDVTWKNGDVGEFYSSTDYIVPGGLTGLTRTSVKARLMVPPTGLDLFPNAADNSFAELLTAGHEYVLQDVDYYGGRI